MDKRKTLLILGNGFDLAHDLHTRYTDFLEYIQKNVNEIRSAENTRKIAESIMQLRDDSKTQNKTMFYDEIVNSAKVRDLEKNIKEIADSLNNGSDNTGIFSQLCELCWRYLYLNGNYWLDYFDKINNKYNWVDFEQEVQQVVSALEQFIIKGYLSDDEYSWLCTISRKEKISRNIIVKDIIPKLLFDLQILTYLLEEYLINETENAVKNEKLDSICTNIDGVITYNYTDVFEKLYFVPNLKIYHIHGALGKHNLVLGIGETLQDNEVNRYTYFSSFKKYFQKIFYRLGNRYKGMLGYKEKEPCPHENLRYLRNRSGDWNVIIYGHSLDVTDSDSLGWIMTHPLVKSITIYYIDTKSLNSIIANMTIILGKNLLLQKVEEQVIHFKRVNNM